MFSKARARSYPSRLASIRQELGTRMTSAPWSMRILAASASNSQVWTLAYVSSSSPCRSMTETAFLGRPGHLSR